MSGRIWPGGERLWVAEKAYGVGARQSVQLRTDPSGFGAKEAEAPHFIEESCTFKAEACRSAVWSADDPVCGLQSLQNMLALNLGEGATSGGIVGFRRF